MPRAMTYFGASNEALVELDEMAKRVRTLMEACTDDQVNKLWQQLDLTLIYHGNALEGQVYTPEEIHGAFDNRTITDSSSLPIYLALRAHRDALELSRETASAKKLVFTLDLFREFHVVFAENKEAAKTAGHRKDIPLHRTYFHEICNPVEVGPSMRQLLAWLNDPEEAFELHPVIRAAKFHARFMKIFPFIETSGKVGRIMMNVMLMRHGFLPAVILATERQRYYEAIRQSQDDLVQLIIDASMISLEAADKFFRKAAIAS